LTAVNASAPAGDAAWAPLVDVSRMPIAELHGAGDTVLGRTLERLIRSLDDPDGVISAFGSFISDS
jgi:FXSXX-COOH protein